MLLRRRSQSQKGRRAQLQEEANSPSVTILRKGINKELDIVNIDLLEAAAKQALPEGVFVFIANGNGEQWTLRENRRGLATTRSTRIGCPASTGQIDTSVTLLPQEVAYEEDDADTRDYKRTNEALENIIFNSGSPVSTNDRICCTRFQTF